MRLANLRNYMFMLLRLTADRSLTLTIRGMRQENLNNIILFQKCLTTNNTILLWKSVYKKMFNSMFRNVNFCFTLHQEYAHNAVCPEKWSFHSAGVSGRGGGEGGTRLPLSEFSGSAPGQYLIEEKKLNLRWYTMAVTVQLIKVTWIVIYKVTNEGKCITH